MMGSSQKKDLFPKAKSYPPFFDHNLLDDSRVILKLSGKEGCFQIFYFQLFKLFFQLQSNSQIKQGKFQKHGSNSYSDAFLKKIKNRKANIFQPRDVHRIEQFILRCEKEKQSHCIEYIQQNISVHRSFIGLFESIFFDSSKVLTAKSILDKLSKFFNIQIENYGKCIKFVESDIYVYCESSQELYLCYVESSGQSFSHNPETKDTPKQERKQSQENSHDNDQYLLKENSFIKNQNFQDNQGNFTQGLAKQDQKIGQWEEGSEEQKNEKKERKIDESGFYIPKMNSPLVRERRECFDDIDEDLKGETYRKFTDTRILNMMPEPYRTQVKIIKSRHVCKNKRKNVRQF